MHIADYMFTASAYEQDYNMDLFRPIDDATYVHGSNGELDFDDGEAELLAFDSDEEIPDTFSENPPMDSQHDFPDIPANSSEDDADEDEMSDGDDADPREESIECLEALVLSFMSQLSTSLPSANNPQDRADRKKKIVLELADRRKLKSDGYMATRAIKFPQKAKGASAKPFAQLFRVVDLMHEALHDDIPTTKRDMYYKDVSLFKSQGVVDKLVDDLAATFSRGRADLHVRASSKGLVCGGGLTMHMNSGEVIHVQESEGTLIPVGEEIAHFEVSAALAWVLIVEKEAVFQTLCRLRLADHPALPGRGIVITGKGYPDVATRQLVRTLADRLPARVPLVALVDSDAFGLDILSVYRFGSTGMQHERACLAAARVRWLGIWASELAGLGVDRDALIAMTGHDEKKARAMLRRPDLPKRWRKELQCMLHSRRKAEIEVLSTLIGACDVEPDDAPGTARRAKRVTPMLRYLADKITAVVADYVQKTG